LGELKAINERIVGALLIREYFTQFFQSPTVQIAKLRWYKLLKIVKEVDIAAFNEFFRKLKEWSPQLWNYFSHRTDCLTVYAESRCSVITFATKIEIAW